MAKKRKQAKRLTPMQVKQMIVEWHDKSAEDFAEEFGVSPSTIANMGKAVRTMTDNEYCPRKGGGNRKDTVAAALKILQKEE